ncbi:MAG: hypothetical protein IJW00_03135 [Clostridia bacterium]|nr:hypothetical protein [Clostridia bacterium]
MKMRKILAALIAAVMVLSMVPVMAVTVSAVDIEGDWITCRSANDYDEEQENGSYKPAPGYHYTSDGFETIGADYTNTMPYFHVMSREAQSLKEGIYLEVRVDEFDYNGWLSFTLWDSENFSILDTNGYGSGWSSLVNGNVSGGAASVDSSIVLEDGNDIGEQSFMTGLGKTSATPTKDDEGRQIYTLEVNYDGSQYNILVCGELVAGGKEITELFNKISPDGDFYIGLAMFSATTGGKANLSILKYGTSKDDASTPVGSDRAEPETNANVFPDMMPADGVEANQPAFRYDASLYSAPQVANADVTALGDNAFRFTSRTEDMYFRWLVSNTVSYDAVDFPVVAFMVRSYDASGGAVYYCSGDRMAADAEHMTSWGLWDEGCLEYKDEDGVYYNMVVVDLSEQWEGRINLIRFDFFDLDVSDEDDASFDFCWAGTFRSVEEAQAYTVAWAGENGLSDVEDEEPTEEPTETPTEAPTEEATNAPEASTNAEAKTEAPKTEDKKGCGAVMGSAAVLLTAVAAAFCLKRRED